VEKKKPAHCTKRKILLATLTILFLSAITAILIGVFTYQYIRHQSNLAAVIDKI
jgi:hypothetical protein